MCGIFGYYDLRRKALSDQVLAAMAQTVAHRGPDGHGIAHDATAAVAIGCERLAIIDPEQGHQPFRSDDGQISVVQNGAIFNYRELAGTLRSTAHPCRTGSDTEVLLRQYERLGIDFVSSLNGMFAFAIHDRHQDCLYLVRDRVGEKPLYYAFDGERCVFGSEIKTLLCALGPQEVSERSLASYLRFNYVPPPATIYDNIAHVMPGHWVRIDRHGVTTQRYWDAADNEAIELSEQAWIERFDETIDDAVRLRLRSDVPIGAFLSGGVDSSTVVGVMSRHLEQPAKTFSIGFLDKRFDETRYADQAARRFGTEHHRAIVEPDVVDSWPRALYHCDQPHGDASFMPTLRLAELAADSVRVVLTGDGADELFAGYDNYRRFFGEPGNTVGPDYLEHISLFSPQGLRSVLSADRAAPEPGRDQYERVIAPLLDRVKHFDEVNKALYLDTMLLLPGNNLVKPDRLGMAAGIENRSPFLDHRMVELAFSMPGSVKLRDGVTKYIQKKAVAPLIGEQLAFRPKQMFTVPIGEWMKAMLHGPAKRVLLESDACTSGLFNRVEIERMFTAHLQGTANYTRELRALLATELWLRSLDGDLGAWSDQ